MYVYVCVWYMLNKFNNRIYVRVYYFFIFAIFFILFLLLHYCMLHSTCIRAHVMYVMPCMYVYVYTTCTRVTLLLL